MQLTEYPRVRQGQQTRQRLLELITEDPTATLNELSKKLCLSTSQIRRHRKYLKMLGILPLVIFILLTFAPSAFANEFFLSGGESVEDVEVEPVEEEPVETEEMEPAEEEADEKPE